MSARFNLSHLQVFEWWHRFQTRLGMMAEDRVPSPAQIELAEAEANEWLAGEMAYVEVDRELSF
jgi:NOL1/NOP2/fmu family ribosome biogenesis protein